MARFGEDHGSERHQNKSKRFGKQSNGFKKPRSSNKKQTMRGVNAWRDQKEDDKPKEEIVEKKPFYTITEEGKKVKEFKKGAVRQWIDLNYEENDEVAYYEGFYVKRSAVETLDKLRESFEINEMKKDDIRKKMMKAVRKENKSLHKEKLYAKKNEMIKDGTFEGPIKVWNKKNKKDTEDKSKKDENCTQSSVSINSKVKQEQPMQLEQLKSPQKRKVDNLESIESLDCNFKFDSLCDNEDEENKKADMDFNGIPYTVIETNLDRLDEMSDTDEEMETEKTIPVISAEVTDDCKTKKVSIDNETIKLEQTKVKKSLPKSSASPVKLNKETTNKNLLLKTNATSEKLNKHVNVNDDKHTKVKDVSAHRETHKTQTLSIPTKPVKLVYEENKIMTRVDGFWIRRNSLVEVDKINTAKRAEIMAGRPADAEALPYLTEEEEKQSKANMRNDLNRFANQLNSFLRKIVEKKSKNTVKRLNTPKSTDQQSKIKKSKAKAYLASKAKTSLFGTGVRVNHISGEQEDDPPSDDDKGKEHSSDSKPRDGFRKYRSDSDNAFYTKAYSIEKKGKYLQDSSLPGMIRFDGYWIKKEAAEELKQLKNTLKSEGVPTEQIAERIKQERRRVENKESKERGVVCFSCRKHGHVISDCPLKQNVEGIGACFKCGSLEHLSSACTDGTARTFAHATCFICRERGHISRECPKNKNGLYPNGGGCTLCDSNQHLIKDCPRNVNEKRNKKLSDEVLAEVFRPGDLLERDETADSAPVEESSKKRKHVCF